MSIPVIVLAAAITMISCASAREESGSEKQGPPVVTRHNPSGVAPPIGAYSHVGVVKPGAELVVLAGQLGLSPEGQLPPTVEEQCANALGNVRKLLESEGIGPENIIKANIWLVDPIDRARFSELWGQFIDGNPPPTMFAYISGLARPEYLVEVEVWAVR